MMEAESMEWVAGAVAIALVTVGCVGIFLPVIPGVALIFLGLLFHKWMVPEVLSWWTVGLAGTAAVLSAVAEWVASALGAHWGGAGRWGVGGAVAGGLIGLFFAPLGLIVGPIAGAVLGEWAGARRPFGEAWHAGLGTAAGLLASLGAKVLLAMVVVMVAIWDAVM